jgi:hypothetical protein
MTQQPIICATCSRASAPTGRNICAECWDAETTLHRARYLASLQNSEHEESSTTTQRPEATPQESHPQVR